MSAQKNDSEKSPGLRINSDTLEEIKKFASHQSPVRGLALFGSYARKEQTALSDLDLIMILDKHASNEELFQVLLSSLTQKPWAVLHPVTNKWILFFENGMKKVDLFIVHSAHEIEHYFRSSHISSAADAILVDKDGQLERLITISQMNRSHQGNKEMRTGTVEKFLESFYLASYYSAKGDRYLFFFNYSIAHFHLAELMQIETGNYSYLYSPRNLLDRISPARKEQLEMTSIGVVHFDEQKHLHQIAKVFLDIYQEISRQHTDLPWTIPSTEFFFRKHLDSLNNPD